MSSYGSQTISRVISKQVSDSTPGSVKEWRVGTDIIITFFKFFTRNKAYTAQPENTKARAEADRKASLQQAGSTNYQSRCMNLGYSSSKTIPIETTADRFIAKASLSKLPPPMPTIFEAPAELNKAESRKDFIDMGLDPSESSTSRPALAPKMNPRESRHSRLSSPEETSQEATQRAEDEPQDSSISEEEKKDSAVAAEATADDADQLIPAGSEPADEITAQESADNIEANPNAKNKWDTEQRRALHLIATGQGTSKSGSWDHCARIFSEVFRDHLRARGFKDGIIGKGPLTSQYAESNQRDHVHKWVEALEGPHQTRATLWNQDQEKKVVEKIKNAVAKIKDTPSHGSSTDAGTSVSGTKPEADGYDEEELEERKEVKDDGEDDGESEYEDEKEDE